MTQRRGFTLVELLVVASMLIMLYGLVAMNTRPVPNVARAAQDFASQLLATQSRALGRTEGAALIVEAVSGDPRLGGATVEAAMRPPIVVDVGNGTLVSSPELASGYKVRFRDRNGEGAFPVTPWLGLEAGVPVRRESAGQTASNTILMPPGANLEAVVVRYPTPGTRSSTLATQLAIDLRHSGVGDDPAALHGHGTFEGQGPVAIVFDQTGRVSEVILRVGIGGGTAPIVPNELIYFYFVSRDPIAQSASLASISGAWVAIEPLTGRITVSSNVPAAEDQVIAAREKARQGIPLGR